MGKIYLFAAKESLENDVEVCGPLRMQLLG